MGSQAREKMYPVAFHTGRSLRSSLSGLAHFAHRPALDLSDPLSVYAHRCSDLLRGQQFPATSEAKATRANLPLPPVEWLENQPSRKTAGLKCSPVRPWSRRRNGKRVNDLQYQPLHPPFIALEYPIDEFVGRLDEEQLACARGSLTSKPTWLNTAGYSVTSAFCFRWCGTSANKRGYYLSTRSSAILLAR